MYWLLIDCIDLEPLSCKDIYISWMKKSQSLKVWKWGIQELSLIVDQFFPVDFKVLIKVVRNNSSFIQALDFLQFCLILNNSRGVVPGGTGGAMAHPDFGRSVNPISTRGDRLCPPNYYWHPDFQTFRRPWIVT